MKKTYIIPTCEIVKLNPTDIIVTSPDLPFGDVNDNDQRSRGRGNLDDFDDDFFEE